LKKNVTWTFTEYGEFNFLSQIIVQKSKNASEPQPEIYEYDVVKKQRTITNASSFAGSDMSEALLGNGFEYFYQFSHDVMGALESTLHAEAKIIREESEWMLMEGLLVQGKRIGYTYAAWNPGFLDELIIKIGATVRDSPFVRLKELSRCTPYDYVLIACIPSLDPFAVEKLCHQHFEDKRVWRASTGRKTEFFKISKDEVEKYFTTLNNELMAAQEFLDA
jgi:hypothetical protein